MLVPWRMQLSESDASTTDPRCRPRKSTMKELKWLSGWDLADQIHISHGHRRKTPAWHGETRGWGELVLQEKALPLPQLLKLQPQIRMTVLPTCNTLHFINQMHESFSSIKCMNLHERGASFLLKRSFLRFSQAKLDIPCSAATKAAGLMGSWSKTGSEISHQSWQLHNSDRTLQRRENPHAVQCPPGGLADAVLEPLVLDHCSPWCSPWYEFLGSSFWREKETARGVLEVIRGTE